MREQRPLPPLEQDRPQRAAGPGGPRAPAPFDEFAPGAGLRDVVGWLATIALAVALAAWLAAWSARQPTSEEAALPALERAIVALTELDGLLDLHAAAIAEQARAGGEVDVPGFPLDVPVPAAEARDPTALRAAVLAASAALVRVEGSAAFHDPDGAPAEASTLSSAGLMQALIDGLTADRHDRWAGLVRPLGLLSALLGAAVLVLGVGFGRFVRLGAVLAVAAALVLVPAVALREGLGFVGDDDIVGDEALAIAQSLASGPVRNALWLAAAGVAIALPAALLDRLFEASERRAPSPSPARAGELPPE